MRYDCLRLLKTIQALSAGTEKPPQSGCYLNCLNTQSNHFLLFVLTYTEHLWTVPRDNLDGNSWWRTLKIVIFFGKNCFYHYLTNVLLSIGCVERTSKEKLIAADNSSKSSYVLYKCIISMTLLTTSDTKILFF